MSRCFVKFVFLLTACGLFQSLCFAGKEHDEETKKSLQRIYDVCGYTGEARDVQSTRRIIIADDGYDTLHKDLTGVFVDPYDPVNASNIVNRFPENYGLMNVHGTAVAGIIHDLTPTAKLIPVIYRRNYNDKCYIGEVDHQLISLDYALNKTQGDIVNLSITLSQGGYAAAPISANVKDLLMKAFAQPQLIVCAAGNSHHAMSDMPVTQELKELAKLSNDKLIVVGATVPDQQGKEELWFDGSQLKTGEADQKYLSAITLGSSYPGDDESCQEISIVAPAYHYAPYAFYGYRPVPSNTRKYFGMTSSAAPVVTSFIERLWTNAPNSTASNVGNALYNGTYQSFSGYTRKEYGEGLANYTGSLSLLETSPYQSLKVIEN